MNIEDIKEAIEVLEDASADMLMETGDENYYGEAIAVLRQAIKQAEQQEPFEYWSVAEGWVKIDEVREHFDMVGCGTIYKTAGEGRSPLYTTPPPRQPLPPQSPCEMTPVERKMFRLGWLECEAAHGIGEKE